MNVRLDSVAVNISLSEFVSPHSAIDFSGHRMDDEKGPAEDMNRDQKTSTLTELAELDVVDVDATELTGLSGVR